MNKILTLFKKTSIAAIFSKVISALLTFLFLFLVARSISTQEAGIFLYSYSIMMILVQLARAGTDNAIIKQLAHKKSASEHKNVITQTGLFVFFTSIILCLIMALLSFFNMFPIYESELARFVLYSFLIITLIFSFIQVLASYFQSQVMVYSQYWSLGLGVSFAGVVACLAVYWMNLNVLYLSVFFIILCFFVALSCLVIFSFKLNKLPIENDVKDFNKLNFKRTLTYTLPYTAIAFIMIIIQQGGALLSGFWLTETELALISVALDCQL